VNAVVGELTGGNVLSNEAGICSSGDHTRHQLKQPALQSANRWSAMKGDRQLIATMASALPADVCIGLQHSAHTFGRVAGPVPDCLKLSEVAQDLALVPGTQNLLNIRKVLIERRPADSRRLSDIGHGHPKQAAVEHQLAGSVQDRFAHFLAVRLQGLTPQLRHLDRILVATVEYNVLISRHSVLKAGDQCHAG